MTAKETMGVVDYDNNALQRKTDYLYRVSLKCLVRNERGEVLVVKEAGRENWDLPGGGMDHGEDIASVIAREMKEEINLEGKFTFRIIDVEEPGYLSKRNFWQIRLIFEVKPENLAFTVGEDGDMLAFKDPKDFQESDLEVERLIYRYSQRVV